ncbi:MAG: multicopper oxidase domain-containing protein [Neptuniibacter sp.]
MKKLIATTLLSVVFITPEVFAGVKEHSANEMPHHNEMMKRHHMIIGQPGKSSEINKTIPINANDQMNFSLNTIELKEGQTIEFVVTNTGQLPHEFVLGTREQIEMHRREMRDMPDMQHSDNNSLSLKSGETKALIWKFSSVGDFLAACTLPGHYEAGMITEIKVGKNK